MQISSLDSKLTIISTELKLEAKFPLFFKTYTDMSTAFNTFNTSVLNYIDNPNFSEKLNDFVKDYEKKNYEFQLITIATSSLGGIKSLVETFKDVAINYDKSDNSPIISSTSKVIFEFYLLIMMRILEGFSLLKFCYMMQESISGGNE